jgi:hypothetical protein
MIDHLSMQPHAHASATSSVGAAMPYIPGMATCLLPLLVSITHSIVQGKWFLAGRPHMISKARIPTE